MFREIILILTLSVCGCLCGSCREAKLCCPGRDSSCVVQKAPINAIIEDLSDKPCYCDHACLKLGDCCSDFKAACGDINQVSSSPKNVNLQLTPEGYKITWDPPEQGANNLDYYEVHWTKDKDTVTDITKEPYYLVKDFVKGQSYQFQVFAVSKSNYRSESSLFAMHLMPDQKVKTITLGVSLGFVLLVITILLSWYIHRYFAQKS